MLETSSRCSVKNQCMNCSFLRGHPSPFSGVSVRNGRV
jgi:hypothetical protein